MSTAEGVGMEWKAQTLGAQAVFRCSSPLTTTVATTSAAQRNHPLFSGPDQPVKTPLNGMSG